MAARYSLIMFTVSNSQTQSQPLMDLQNQLAPAMAELTKFLETQIEAFESQIRFLVDYCLKNSGKRIRPSLVFLTGHRDDRETQQKLVRVAAVVEMVHIATLVHDDILDHAEKRRGQPTISSQFGTHTAVLLGDALFSHALHLAAQFDTVEVCRLVSRSTRRVCSGEIVQTFCRGDWNLPLDQYLELLGMKTGELFSASTYLGGLLSRYPREHCRVLKRFGSHLGIAYQAYDDLADFIGDEKIIGKTLGTDLSTGKATLPLILLFNRQIKTATVEMTRALQNSDEAAVRDILEAHGVFDQGYSFVSNLLDKAVSILEELPQDLKARSNLHAISQLLREKLEELELRQIAT